MSCFALRRPDVRRPDLRELAAQESHAAPALLMRRRVVLSALAATLAGASFSAWAALRPGAVPAPRDALPRLGRAESQSVRDWITLLVHAQLQRGPTPRWTHRDCAGLVRFAVGESLRPHDLAWKRANGFLGAPVPAELDAGVGPALRNAWLRADGTRGAFVGALELVQQNTRFRSRQLALAAPADLLLYDFGDEQHLMLWMGSYIAYHTGHVEPGDNGLRALRPAQLFAWNDTRWRPSAENPNFSGIHALDFLA